MGSYITAIVVATSLVLGLYVTLERTTGNPVFAQDRLDAQSEDQLRTLAEDFTSPEQIEAILQLGNRPGDLSKTVPILAKLATVRNEDIKNAADSSLESIGAPAAEHIKDFFEEGNTRGYRIACSAARAIGPACKIYLEDIKRLLGDDDPLHRKCGLYALQGMGEEAKAAMDEVIICVLDADLNNQCSACRVLEKFGRDAIPAEKALLELQKTGGPSTRGWAAVCLGAIGPTSSDVDVAQLLADQLKPRADGRPVTPIEQERVLTGLAYLGPEATSALPMVEEKMTGKSLYVRGFAAYAHYRITGDSEKAMTAIRSLLNDEQHVSDGLYLLSKMGPDALPMVGQIANGLRASDSSVREMAVIAVGNIGPAANEYRGQIEERLNDTDPLVRLAARRALANMTTDDEKPASTDSATDQNAEQPGATADSDK